MKTQDDVAKLILGCPKREDGKLPREYSKVVKYREIWELDWQKFPFGSYTAVVEVKPKYSRSLLLQVLTKLMDVKRWSSRVYMEIHYWDEKKQKFICLRDMKSECPLEEVVVKMPDNVKYLYLG